jgi:hypothetical protein
MKCPRCEFELINLLLPRAALRPKHAATGGEGEFLLFGSICSVDSLNLRDVGYACLWQVSFAFPQPNVTRE